MDDTLNTTVDGDYEVVHRLKAIEQRGALMNMNSDGFFVASMDLPKGTMVLVCRQIPKPLFGSRSLGDIHIKTKDLGHEEKKDES